MPFCTSKGRLLERKRASFRTQKGVDEKADGNNLYNRTLLPFLRSIGLYSMNTCTHISFGEGF